MKTFSLLFIAFFALNIYSQDNYMALSFGRTFPQNDFAKTESIYENGFAFKGFLAEYSGAYFPIDYIGLGGALKFSTNYIDQPLIKEQFIAMLPGEVTESTPLIANIGLWNIVSIAAGPHFSYPKNRLSFDGYFYIGFNIVYPPKMEFTADMGADGIYSTTSKFNNIKLGFDTGVNIKYRLNDNVGLKVFVGYQQSTAEGDLYLYSSSDQSNTSSPYLCKIQLINTGIGLVYIL